MSENNQEQKRIVYVGFFSQELRDLIEHLRTTGYNEEQTNHIEEVLNSKASV